MRHKVWILLLVAGLAAAAKPAGRRVRRTLQGRQAAAVWAAARARSFAGESGEPFGWLNIPAAGISELVRNGQGQLSVSPGAETVGNSILILAHRDTQFRRLGSVGPGDRIQLEQHGGQQHAYRCLETLIVDQGDAEAFVQAQRKNDRLLLVTCYPFRYIGPAPRRFIVVCGRV